MRDASRRLGLGVLGLALTAILLPAAANADVDLWPLFEWSDERQTLLYPLYSREGDSVTAFPLYYRTHEGRDHHLVWPLVKISDGALVRAAPFWFREQEGRYVLFPLFYQTEHSFTSLVPPMHLRKDEDFLVVLPFFARTEGKLWLAPNFYVEREQGELKRFVSFPFVDVERKGASRRVSAALVAGARLQQGDLEHLWLFPLFSLDRRDSSRHLWLAPVYVSDETTAVLPLYSSHDDGSKRHLWVLPYYEQDSPQTHERALLPFYSTRRVEWPERTERNVTALWPVYARKEVRDAEGTLREQSRRFLIFRDQLRPDGVRRFEILGVPIAERVEGA